MNTNKREIVLTIALLLFSSTQLFAIEGLKLTIICPDVVLSWPGATGETYIVQFRETLDASSPWVTLTNSLPAQSGTNLTTFVHSNQVDCPTGQVFGMMSGDSMGGLAATVLSAEERKQRLAVQALAQLEAVFEKSKQEGREPYVWELEGRPPLPWEIDSIKKPAGGVGTKTEDSFPGSNGPQIEELSGGSPGTGFYRVVRNDLHVFAITGSPWTNGAVLAGVLSLPIEFGYANPTNPAAVLDQIFLSHTNNGENVHGAVFPDMEQAAAGGLVGMWDTRRVTNGTYVVQLGASLDDGTLVENGPITVTVSNAIWFPDYCDIGGAAIYVGAQTVFSNGAWRLDVYDDQGTVVQTNYGSIDASGWCAWPGVAGPGFSLSNIGTNGLQNPSTFYDLVVTVYTFPGSGSSVVAPPSYYSIATNRVFIETPWNYTNTTALMCSLDMFSHGQEAKEQLDELMKSTLGAMEPFHHNLVGSPLSPYEVAENAIPSLITYLTNSLNRDFYYFGHGSGTGLGAAVTNSLRISAVNAALANNTTDPLKATNRHPYRFVFLDGCNTADGNWPQAFGIPKQAGMTAANFANDRGIRPRAFMGWNRKKPLIVLGQSILDTSHIAFDQTFWLAWATTLPNGQRLGVQAAIDAGKAVTQSGSTGITLYGATDMRIDY